LYDLNGGSEALPTYGYECLECKEKFEVIQKITEDALTQHDGCGGALRKLLYPVGIVFKGSGFYVNDYAKSGRKDASAEPKTETKAEGKSETKGETKTETKTETKAESAPAPKAEAAATA
jgi:putative FmdB family regulatory protein